MINKALISYKNRWEEKLLNQLKEWYKKAFFYDDIINIIMPIILNKYNRLIDLNYNLNKVICDYVGISTPIYFSSKIPTQTEEKNQRILEICKYFDKVNLLYDGKSAANFLDTELFMQNGIEVIFQNYVQNPYRQLWGKFEPYMSIIDLIMNNSPKESLNMISQSPLPKQISLYS